MDGKPNGFWLHQLARLTEKRNRKMRDAVNKAAKIVINHCRENQSALLFLAVTKVRKTVQTWGTRLIRSLCKSPRVG